MTGFDGHDYHITETDDDIDEENIVTQSSAQTKAVSQAKLQFAENNENNSSSQKPIEGNNRAIGLALRQTLIKLETARHILDKAMANKAV